MTLPPHFTTLDLSGRFILNTSLSDSAEQILEQQGVADAALRHAIAHGVLSFNHYTSDDGEQHIWVDQELEGRCLTADEDRALDWRERARDDPLVGPVVGRIRRVKTHALEPPFLRAGWTPDTRKYGVLNYAVYSDTKRSGRTWAVTETWGIEEIAGMRHFARHIEFTGPDGKDVERHLVYDYVGSV
ncbi:hypothetical protein DFH07DRAFT_354845 [Mycena maculata]|uniref:Uncharacterized protein n=1 Tax=Mycena maculata TaxID=230809 RepID=A0AAD7HAK0_9AGAR|nr:hypothetical protein DFH07DRAFT_354845 [Mycena maculata]